MKALSQTQASHLDVNKPPLLGDVMYTLCFVSFFGVFALFYSRAISCNLIIHPFVARLEAFFCCSVRVPVCPHEISV